MNNSINFRNTGKVKLITRDFPLGFHPYAKTASMATECADEQGKFWEMKDKVFTNQTALTKEDLKKYAKEIGLNETKFNSCLDSEKYKDEVEKDLTDGMNAGVEGTPSFFVNGKLLVGAQPFSVFKQVIESELNAE